MRIAVDPTNPDVVVVPADGNEVPSALFAVAMINGVVLAAGLARWSAVRRAERMVVSGQPSFAMIGSLERSARDRRRVVLHLFALDSGPGARAVCSCTVLTTAQMPIGGPGFPVEVRGRPVPGGTLVARAEGDGLLWPLRRPIGRGAGRRPAEVLDRRRPLVPVDDGSVTGPAPPLLRALGGLRLAAGAGVAVVLLVVPLVVSANGAAARRVTTRGVPVLAEVVEKTGTDSLRVRYGRPGQPRDKAASTHGDRTLHRIYPAHVGPGEPGDLRLDADPYNATEPYVWVAVCVAAAVALVVGRLGWWGEARRLARRGPWFAVERLRDEGNREIGVVVAGETHPIAFYRGRLLPSSPPTAGSVLVAATFDSAEPAVIAGGGARIEGPVELLTPDRRSGSPGSPGSPSSPGGLPRR